MLKVLLPTRFLDWHLQEMILLMLQLVIIIVWLAVLVQDMIVSQLLLEYDSLKTELLLMQGGMF